MSFFRDLWFAHEMFSRILFSRILKCLFLTAFSQFFGFFHENKWLFWHFFVYFESQTKICFEEVKTSSKSGEKKFGSTKTKLMRRSFCNWEIYQTIRYFIHIREDKTIESAVPFPAPEKGDNRGLSPFHPRIIIVIGECPLLSPVWKSSPLPQKPLKRLENLPPSPSPVTGAGTGNSFNVPFRPL